MENNKGGETMKAKETTVPGATDVRELAQMMKVLSDVEKAQLMGVAVGMKLAKEAKTTSAGARR